MNYSIGSETESDLMFVIGKVECNLEDKYNKIIKMHVPGVLMINEAGQ